MILRKQFVCAGLILLTAAVLLLAHSEAAAQWLWARKQRPPAPVPLGASVNEWNGTMVAAADIDHFVIYRHEWFLGGTTLGPYGSYHLQEISKRISSTPHPILIQIDGNETLNAARRTIVINHLAALGMPDAPQRVVVGHPKAEGLNGDEAARIFGQMFGVGGTIGGYGAMGGGYGGGLPAASGLGTSFGSGFGGGFRGY